jgi:hypothetical protein
VPRKGGRTSQEVNLPMTKTKRGKRMTRGMWKLEPKTGRARGFTGSLMGTFNFGTRRIAVFNVPKRFKG